MEESQKYKEGKFILEKAKIMKVSYAAVRMSILPPALQDCIRQGAASSALSCACWLHTRSRLTCMQEGQW